MAILATAAQVQIGYKGQLTLGASGGVNQTGGVVAACYLSSHSILGVEALYDKTSYNAGVGNSSSATQWLGNIRYQYALPMGKFVLLPAGGFLFGVETCDPETQQGNLLLYGSQFVSGVSAEFNVEYVLGRHWTIALPQCIFEGQQILLGVVAGTKFHGLDLKQDLFLSQSSQKTSCVKLLSGLSDRKVGQTAYFVP